jgi:hypothetical protein
MMQWQCFDVALWRSACGKGFPLVAHVRASSAFAAVEVLMQRVRWSFVADASVRACAGSLCYRARRVEVVLHADEQARAWYAVRADCWWSGCSLCGARHSLTIRCRAFYIGSGSSGSGRCAEGSHDDERPIVPGVYPVVYVPMNGGAYVE